jgi:hypothetical protein
MAELTVFDDGRPLTGIVVPSHAAQQQGRQSSADKAQNIPRQLRPSSDNDLTNHMRARRFGNVRCGSSRRVANYRERNLDRPPGREPSSGQETQRDPVLSWTPRAYNDVRLFKLFGASTTRCEQTNAPEAAIRLNSDGSVTVAAPVMRVVELSRLRSLSPLGCRSTDRGLPRSRRIA